MTLAQQLAESAPEHSNDAEVLLDRRSGRILGVGDLPQDCSLNDMLDFCREHDVRFHSLDSYSNETAWGRLSSCFHVRTYDEPERGLNVDYAYVRDWRDKRSTFKPALALSAAAGVIGVTGDMRRVLVRGGLVRSVQALDALVSTVKAEMDAYTRAEGEED